MKRFTTLLFTFIMTISTSSSLAQSTSDYNIDASLSHLTRTMTTQSTNFIANRALSSRQFDIPMISEMDQDIDPEGHFSLTGHFGRDDYKGPYGDLDLKGHMKSYAFGIDYTKNRWLLGLSFGRHMGDGLFLPLFGKVETTTGTAMPYAAYHSESGNFVMWGGFGIGMGHMQFYTENSIYKTEMKSNMIAVGLENTFLKKDNGIRLAFIVDGQGSKLKTEPVSDLLGYEATSKRYRLGLKGLWDIHLYNDERVITPSLTFALRRDVGSIQDEKGFDLGAGLSYTEPVLGLQLVGDYRTFISYDDSYKDSGIGLSVVYDPRPLTKRGLSARFLRNFNDTPSDVVSNKNGVLSFSNQDDDRLWDFEVTYGRERNNDLVGTRFISFTGTDENESARIGYRIEPDSDRAENISTSLWVGSDTETNGVGTSLDYRW